MAKFYGNILSLSENIAQSFRGGATFLTHTVQLGICSTADEMYEVSGFRAYSHPL